MRAHAITPRQAGRRQFEMTRQPAVIGEQQQAFGIDVEAADRNHPPEIAGQRVEHRPPALLVAMAGDQAARLVIAPQAGRLGGAEGLAVDHHRVVRGDGDRRGGQGGAVDRDPAGFDPALRLAPRTQAGARHPLGDALANLFAHGRHASTKAANSFVSPSEIMNSGCHWTPMQNLCAGDSMPSITPSGAVASTTRPGAGAATAW